MWQASRCRGNAVDGKSSFGNFSGADPFGGLAGPMGGALLAYVHSLPTERLEPAPMISATCSPAPDRSLCETGEPGEQNPFLTALQTALDRLPGSSAPVLGLLLLAGCSCREIAAYLNLPVDAVKSRLTVGLDHLARELATVEDGWTLSS